MALNNAPNIVFKGMIKNFSFPRAKSPTDFFAQNPLQFNRRAKRGEPKPLANSLLVGPLGIESRTLGLRVRPSADGSAD